MRFSANHHTTEILYYILQPDTKISLRRIELLLIYSTLKARRKVIYVQELKRGSIKCRDDGREREQAYTLSIVFL